jgi:hypothetical protein
VCKETHLTAAGRAVAAHLEGGLGRCTVGSNQEEEGQGVALSMGRR